MSDGFSHTWGNDEEKWKSRFYKEVNQAETMIRKLKRILRNKNLTNKEKVLKIKYIVEKKEI